MGTLSDKKAEIESELSGYGEDINIDISDREIVVDIRKEATEARGQVEQDLSEIRGAVRQEIKDVVGYDIDFMIAVDIKER